jgi:hypothetical protein
MSEQWNGFYIPLMIWQTKYLQPEELNAMSFVANP